MSNIDTSSWQEFSYTDIFELQRVIHKLDKLSLSAKGKTPVYSSYSSNNGIVGYTEQEPDFIVNDANAAYVVFGDHTRTFNIVTESFCVMDNVKVLKPKVVNTDVLLFICTVWKKHIKDLGYARHWSIAKDVKFKLPVTTVYEPDFDYMEKYVSELEQERVSELEQYLKVSGLDDYELTEEEIAFLQSTREVAV